jgi:hypothetical protein
VDRLTEVADERTPPDLREGVRKGILGALAADFELSGGRTAGRLIGAGVLGVAAAVAITLLISGHPFAHHPPWHVLVFSTVWAGLMVVSLALILLRVRTPTWPIARAAATGVLALGLAGFCSLFCPDPHFFDWWISTAPGSWVAASGGQAASALYFGLVTSFLLGAVATLVAFRERLTRLRLPLLPASFVFVLLAPGIILQSVGMSPGVSIPWLLGTGVGSYAGTSGAMVLHSWFQPQ